MDFTEPVGLFMNQAQIKSVQCISTAGLHHMSYKEWGDPDNPRVLVCVHGLTRVGDDFDAMAQALCDRVRVVCPDVVGRGRSGRLANPALYQVAQYVSDMVTLLARVLHAGAPQQVDWFGTSMGGLIGMGLASLPGSPVARLILNDIGPRLDAVAMVRIAEYLGKDLRFADFDTASAYVRQISLTFGPHSEAEWRKIAADVLRQLPDGQWTRHYDLNLAQPFAQITPQSAEYGQAALWQAYDAIQCPTLLVRGQLSDLLSAETAQEMTLRGPRAQLVELPGIGHAPTFVHADQIELVEQFLGL
jgi:pimeloyl-ACP methyl ester carboxylesterase